MAPRLGCLLLPAYPRAARVRRPRADPAPDRGPADARYRRRERLISSYVAFSPRAWTTARTISAVTRAGTPTNQMPIRAIVVFVASLSASTSMGPQYVSAGRTARRRIAAPARPTGIASGARRVPPLGSADADADAAGAHRRAHRPPDAARPAAARPGGGHPPPHAASGPARAGALHRARGAARRLHARGPRGCDHRGRRGEDDDHAPHPARRGGRRAPGLRAAHAPGADADVAHGVRAPRRGGGGRRAGRVAEGATHERRDTGARPRLPRRGGEPVGADHVRPHAAAARAAAAGGLLAGRPSAGLRDRPAPAARRGDRGGARARALPRRLRAGEPPRRRGLGRSRAARLRRGVGAS